MRCARPLHGIRLDTALFADYAVKHHFPENPLFVVNDTAKDARFARNQYVTQDPHLRFYAGASITTGDGMLCTSQIACLRHSVARVQATVWARCAWRTASRAL